MILKGKLMNMAHIAALDYNSRRSEKTEGVKRSIGTSVRKHTEPCLGVDGGLDDLPPVECLASGRESTGEVRSACAQTVKTREIDALLISLQAANDYAALLLG